MNGWEGTLAAIRARAALRCGLAEYPAEAIYRAESGLNVYDDPWLVAANAAILRARERRAATPGGAPPPEFADLTHGTMTAYRRGCRCEKCWRRNYERGLRQRQARRQREATA